MVWCKADEEFHLLAEYESGVKRADSLFFSNSIVRQRNKIVGISNEAAAFLRGFF